MVTIGPCGPRPSRIRVHDVMIWRRSRWRFDVRRRVEPRRSVLRELAAYGALRALDRPRLAAARAAPRGLTRGQVDVVVIKYSSPRLLRIRLIVEQGRDVVHEPATNAR